MIFKTLFTWLMFMLFGIIHFRIQDSFLVPGMGALPAHLMGTVFFCMVAVGITVIFFTQTDIHPREKRRMSLLWPVLCLVFIGLMEMYSPGSVLNGESEEIYWPRVFLIGVDIVAIGLSPRIATKILSRWGT